MNHLYHNVESHQRAGRQQDQDRMDVGFRFVQKRFWWDGHIEPEWWPFYLLDALIKNKTAIGPIRPSDHPNPQNMFCYFHFHFQIQTVSKISILAIFWKSKKSKQTKCNRNVFSTAAPQTFSLNHFTLIIRTK